MCETSLSSTKSVGQLMLIINLQARYKIFIPNTRDISSIIIMVLCYLFVTGVCDVIRWCLSFNPLDRPSCFDDLMLHRWFAEMDSGSSKSGIESRLS